MAATFKVGDKVEHRTFGAGEVAFGPFEHHTDAESYLMKEAGSERHALVLGEALSPAAKFKVGDKVTGSHSGNEYTIEAGPFFSPNEWYATKSTAGYVTSNRASVLHIVEAEAADEPVKVGDVVRILEDKAFSANVRRGDLFEVKRLAGYAGRIKVDAAPGAHMAQWTFRPEDFEKVSADMVHVHDGKVYDLTASYRDRDGDVWHFARFGSEVRANIGSKPESQWDGDSFRIAAGYGPLTRV
ncbi:phiSA1p31-related protein [Streptomyces sp. NBC_00076]|uniref:phiSA1p31-related protein n=1 Tax=Streptomyces sp. NBC_00076 TaxID=2975642 RepID=UPI003253DDC0